MTLRPELEANNAKPHGLHLNCIYIGCIMHYILYICAYFGLCFNQQDSSGQWLNNKMQRPSSHMEHWETMLLGKGCKEKTSGTENGDRKVDQVRRLFCTFCLIQ